MILKKKMTGVLAPAVLAVATGAGIAGTASADEVKFGALYPLSGSLALLGEESFRGLELAVEEINANGGVQGQQIVLAGGDAVDQNQAIGEARRLISREDVEAIFGTYSSSRSIAASQVSELAGVPYFELGAVAHEITNRDFDNIYRTNPTARHMARTHVDMIVDAIAPELGRDPADLRIGIIHEDSNYGSSVASFQEVFGEEAGLNIVVNEAYPASTVDMSSIVLRLQERDVDIVLQTSYQDDSILFLRQANERGFEPSAIIGGGGGYSMVPTAEAVGFDVIEGVLNADFTQYAVNADFATGVNDFVEAYQEKYDSDPRSGHSLNNYVGAKVILEALDEGNGFSPEAIAEALSAVDVPAGETAVGYGVKFAENGQNDAAFMMGMQWRDGALVTVYPPEAAVADLEF
jgi:branched-chain amino acid transport system substrate-binding protein